MSDNDQKTTAGSGERRVNRYAVHWKEAVPPANHTPWEATEFVMAYTAEDAQTQVKVQLQTKYSLSPTTITGIEPAPE